MVVGDRIKYVVVGIEYKIQMMTGVEKLNVEERTLLIKIEYFFQNIKIKYNECGQAHA